MLCALALLSLTVSPPLVTAEGSPVDQLPRPAVWATPAVGAQLDVGVPDGIGLSVVLTPGRFVRLSLGAVSNGVGTGVRGGVMLVTFPSSTLRPILSVDGGYVFGGEGAWLPSLITNEVVRKAITGLSVGFVSAQLGVELGSKHFALTLRGGISYVDATARNQSFPTGSGSTLTAQQLGLRGFLPAARLGFIFRFS